MISVNTGNNYPEARAVAREYGNALKYWSVGLGTGAVVGVGVGIIACLIAAIAAGPVSVGLLGGGLATFIACSVTYNLIAGLVAGGIAAFIVCSVAHVVYSLKSMEDLLGDESFRVALKGWACFAIGILLPIVSPYLYTWAHATHTQVKQQAAVAAADPALSESLLRESV